MDQVSRVESCLLSCLREYMHVSTAPIFESNTYVYDSRVSSQAYNYCGEDLLAADKCGEAIRALQESESCLNKAKALCKAYATTKGPAAAERVRPDQHNVFKRLEPMVKRTLEKCNRENGLM